MIKAVVLDVDGVIVGDREGVNFPYPHRDVVEALKKVRKSGIYVSICTGKAIYPVEKIIRDAHLNNLHIVDGGAVGIDPIGKKISFNYAIDLENAKRIIHFYLERNIYMEIYTSRQYFVFKKQINELTTRHSKVLQKEPEIIDRVDSIEKDKDVIKIFLMARDDVQKEFIARSFEERFGHDLAFDWTINPNLKPWQIGFVTAKGVSKRKGVEDISKYLGVPLENILGIGDTMHDWKFMKICGYEATMEDASEELKGLVLEKGERGYVGKSVNENGIIDVLMHFRLL